MAGPTPAKKSAKKPGRKPMDRLRAEVQVGASIGVLCGVEIAVKPAKKWKASAIDAIERRNYQEWARTSLEGDGFATWCAIDPDLEQIDEFVATLRDVTGEDLGESAAS